MHQKPVHQLELHNPSIVMQSSLMLDCLGPPQGSSQTHVVLQKQKILSAKHVTIAKSNLSYINPSKIIKEMGATPQEHAPVCPIFRNSFSH